MSSQPIVASFCSTFLAPEMLHVYRQIIALSNDESFILTQKRIHADKFPFDDDRVVPLSRPNGLRREWRRFWYRKCKKAPWEIYNYERKEIESVLNERGAELLHIYFGHIGMHLLPLLESKTRPCPMIVSFHGADVAVDMDKAAYRTAMQRVFGSADRILARSDSLVAALRDLGCPAEKIRLSRTGIPLDQWPVMDRKAPVDGAWRLVQTCRLIEKKGLDVSLRVLAQLRQTFPRAQLTIVGEGPLQAELETLAQDLGLGEAVEFTGFIDEEQMREQYKKAHVFIHPSRIGKDGNQEGVPNAMLEAMAGGLPVAATQHGGIPEAVADGASGVLVAEDDWQTLAARLTALLKDEQQWQTMAIAAREAVALRFSRQQQVADLAAIYGELTEK
ncbi:MAG: glycosyltransferase [Verrucomicrobiales bacterium]|nr:glycosyltransferase [Verrucomicrobiales bacterium]